MRLLHLPATAAGLLGAAILPACGGSTSDPAASDVTVSSCAADPAGGKPKAVGKIVNGSSKPSAYTFRVKFKDAAGNQVSEGTSAVGRVEAGGTANWDLTGGVSANGPLTCEVGNVTRNAVGG